MSNADFEVIKMLVVAVFNLLFFFLVLLTMSRVGDIARDLAEIKKMLQRESTPAKTSSEPPPPNKYVL